jgi:D-arabinose 1-dehydrogenase-like Zn-dependent alcohol dehydrogenase
MPPAAACDLLIGIELLPWFKGRNQCVLFNSQLLATLSTFLSASTFPSPTLPAQNEVLIGVEFSPINPNDLMVAQGIYAFRPPLPAVIGNEGVGRVLAVGPGVESVRLGDRVLAPPSSFTWRERIVISAGGLSALPADADPQQLAMLAINPPTAALLLSEYVDLQPGEWVVQNAANSGVGRWVIAFAKTRGLKTVNIVRRPELVASSRRSAETSLSSTLRMSRTGSKRLSVRRSSAWRSMASVARRRACWQRRSRPMAPSSALQP